MERGEDKAVLCLTTFVSGSQISKCRRDKTTKGCWRGGHEERKGETPVCAFVFVKCIKDGGNFH